MIIWVMTRGAEEGTFIVNHEGDVLNSKIEWRQPKIIWTTILQGGAKMAGGQVTTFPLAGNVLTGEESYPFDGRARSVDNVISAEQSCDVDAIC